MLVKRSAIGNFSGILLGDFWGFISLENLHSPSLGLGILWGFLGDSSASKIPLIFWSSSKWSPYPQSPGWGLEIGDPQKIRSKSHLCLEGIVLTESSAKRNATRTWYFLNCYNNVMIVFIIENNNQPQKGLEGDWKMSSVWFSLVQLATFSNAMLFNLQAFLQQPKGADRQ